MNIYNFQKGIFTWWSYSSHQIFLICYVSQLNLLVLDLWRYKDFLWNEYMNNNEKLNDIQSYFLENRNYWNWAKDDIYVVKRSIHAYGTEEMIIHVFNSKTIYDSCRIEVIYYITLVTDSRTVKLVCKHVSLLHSYICKYSVYHLCKAMEIVTFHTPIINRNMHIIACILHSEFLHIYDQLSSVWTHEYKQ